MKQLIKSIIRPPYVYMRYLILRYLKYRYFTPYKTYKSLNLTEIADYPISFFGYYNVSPENRAGNILYCKYNKSKNNVTLCINKNGIEYNIADTEAWNWQQGCMSQWGYCNDQILYFNSYNKEENEYYSTAFDSDSMTIKDIFPLPIYALSKQEDYALTLNFDRLALMRPDYGYFCREYHKLPDNKHDGIWHIDLKTKETQLIITLQQLAEIAPVPSMKGAKHKVNHIDISPDGNRFMFLHRWIGPQGRYMRLITSKKDGSDIYILNGDKMTSHCFWMDNKHIVSFCNTDEFGDSYTIFTDQTSDRQFISKKLPKTDGHPSTILNGTWMVTDSYPERNGMSHLYLYNLKTDKLITLGRFWQPLKFQGPNRIDLHPKWNMSGNKIYFESGHLKTRKLFSIDLTELISK